jgi:prevent-host-death family protein
MGEVQAANAKIHLPQILDAVERGQTIVVTRHGRPVARLVPNTGNRAAPAAQAIDRIKALRSRKERIALDELLSARHEGDRYSCPSCSTRPFPNAGPSTTKNTEGPARLGAPAHG